jgi:hypothetical protein
VWESSHVTTIATADKSRLTIRGIKNGRRYLVKQVGQGWFVMPEPEIPTPKHRRSWDRPKQDLADHLDNLAKEGFSFARTMDKEAPPCRF